MHFKRSSKRCTAILAPATGRVEDTINLLAHAGRKVVEAAASLLDWTKLRVTKEANAPLLVASSVKKALDREWSDARAKAAALPVLVGQLESLKAWVRASLSSACTEPPLQTALATLEQLQEQDLEPDPSGGGVRIRKGVAKDRRISVEDKEMRHGRKSKSKRFNGYKRHVATDLDTNLIVACAVTLANRPEAEAAPELKRDIAHQPKRNGIGELHIDRGYIASEVVTELFATGGLIYCKPWVARNGTLFTKREFAINLRDKTITCPVGHREPFDLGKPVTFDASACDACPLRKQCTKGAKGVGRTISIAQDEPLQQLLRKRIATPAGRKQLRKRVAVEHTLAHVGRKSGRRARYLGVRKNLYDLRRAAALINLETIHRTIPGPLLGMAA